MQRLQLIAIVSVAFGGFAAMVGTHTALAEPNDTAQNANQVDVLTQTCKVECLANERYSVATNDKAGLCDVYLPKSEPPESGHPAVLVVHGGSWTTGDKWTLEVYSRLLASHGFAVVTMNYRLAPKHKFPCQVDDVRQALVWTAENAQRFSIDLNRLGIFGYSAGAHLTAMVGMLADEPMGTRLKASQWKADDPRWKRIPTIHAMCLGGPPCDFRKMPPDNSVLSYFFGGTRRTHADAYEIGSPIVHVSQGDPVTQIIHGETDFMVPIENSRSLQAEMKKLGIDVRLKMMPNQGHMMTFINSQSRQSVLEFFQSVFIKPRLSRWDMRKLGNAPPMKWLDETSPIRELTYEGQAIDGVPTDVFAFYATPGTISGDTESDKNLPAVVLIHGGGGTAFADWVWLWAKRGYAAIAMDLSGRRPKSPKFEEGELVSSMRVKRTRLDRGGPEQGREQKFNSVGGSIEDDWPYHAVSNVVLAHSLIRSFPEVDTDRTAVTGISWGGYTTCIVASVDDRFKAAVPVYGCGFLYDGESVQKPMIDSLAAEKRDKWIQQYDPSSHLPNCRVPILFVNGTNDKHYPLNSYSRCFDLVPKNKQIRIEPMMHHSHQAGWKPSEIGLYIDSKLKGAPPLIQLGKIRIKEGKFEVPFRSEVDIQSAAIQFTTDDGPLVKRTWQTAPATIGEKTISGEVPESTIFFVTTTDQRGAMISTHVVFVTE